MNRLLLLSLTLALIGCSSQDDPGPSESLHTLMDAYVEEYYRLNPLSATYLGDNRFNDRLSIDISEAYRQESRQMYRRFLEKLGEIDPDRLNQPDQLNHEVFAEILSYLL